MAWYVGPGFSQEETFIRDRPADVELPGDFVSRGGIFWTPISWTLFGRPPA